ncbi:MAG: hypothetical protein H6712_31600 [Myxococcales bacterium]|nr:hypothetical protein [Myxococcales bacterium]MCB9718437.1 hypothetical protein [Myxococcales bacterium]
MGTTLRIFAAVVLALTLLTGFYLSGKARRDTEQRVADLQAGVDRGEQAVESEAKALPRSLELDPTQFEARMKEDLARFELPPMSLVDLAAPNAYFEEVAEPFTLAPGKAWSSAHVRIKVRLDKVNYMQRGARISSVHVIARVENISDVPIAYRLVLSGEAGNCEVRGAREHNAVSLAPGEEAEIVVCAGRDRVIVESLEVLEVTMLGHYYLGQVSPTAFGQDAISAASHRPQGPVSMCSDLDTKAHAAYLQAGTASWADMADFYSRHDCHRLHFFPGYHRAEEPLAALPVAPPA